MKILYIVFISFLLAVTPAHAEIMQGNGIRLKSNPFSPFTKEKTELKTPQIPSPTPISDNTSDPTTTQSSTDDPTRFKTGSLSLQITPSRINFGTIIPGEPVIRSIHIDLSTRTGQQLMIQQNDKLKSDTDTIQDTTCDNGVCTHTVADTWTNPLTYGFGYTCRGASCQPDFTENQYKQLPSRSENEPFAPLLVVENGDAQAEILLKVNIPPTSPSKSYNNQISIIAVPKY